MSFRGTLIAVTLGLGLAGCTVTDPNAADPKQRLKDYISTSFAINKVEDRKKLEGFLSGEVKSRLAAWSDEQFKKAFIENKRTFDKLVFKEIKSVSPREVHIVYEITYFDQGRGANAKVTNRKLCELVKEDDQWLIRDVRNIKELVEYQNELSLP